MFDSVIYPSEEILDDRSPVPLTPYGMQTGLELPPIRDYSGVAEPFPSDLIIPESEWKDWIEERESRKLQLSQQAILAGLPHKDQDGIPYCWIFAPVHCLELIRMVQNQPMVELSPGWIGGIIKNYRKEGGWGREGLEGLINTGTVPTTICPEATIDRRYTTEENKQVALNYRGVEWWVLKTVAETISCLLRGIPVAVGLNWWGHEVTYYDAVWVNGKIGVRFRNSWKGYGDNGFAILQGSKMVPDDAVALRTAIPYTRPSAEPCEPCPPCPTGP